MKRDLLGHLQQVRSLLQVRPLGVVVDVDGTVSEIAASPDEACVAAPLKEQLRKAANHLDLMAAVSGRSADNARSLVGVDDLVYVGNHGLEWWQGGNARFRPGIKTYVARIERTVNEIRRQISMDGVVFENKGATLAIHYRRAKEADVAREVILTAIRRSPSSETLRITGGKMVIELRPPVQIDKGWALARLVHDYRLRGVIYLGDDITDIDAFMALRKLRTSRTINGLAVAVLSKETPEKVIEHCDVTLQGVPQVEDFFRWLNGELSGVDHIS